MSSAPRVVCLLPARNVALDLPRWLDEAPAFCDAVVALDDGSTDDTGSVLAAHPMVARLLRNPRRESYLGWHDGENRNRLLAEAGDLEPDWILFLDADERIDPTDAAALRSFLATDALPVCVYGLRVFRMLEDDTHDPEFELDWRLFAYRPGARVPNRRLDFPPVPPPATAELWVPTTLRIKHYGEVGDAGRAARLAKYREADPRRRFASWWDNLPELPPGPFPSWEPRPPDLAVLESSVFPGSRAPLPALPEGARLTGVARPRPAVVCLLPARNCAADLPDYFASVAQFADAVVALDDGSTDDTAMMLANEPMVKVLLRNPRREGYAEWDDSANRNRLLEAAADLSPDWIVSLDSDERIAPDDAVALRRFIDEEALDGFAYGFEIHRMIGDLDHFDRVEFVAYRMFSFAEGQRFPDDRLHFVPVPSSIPDTRWLETSIRIQHLAALDEARRQRRWSKYQEADPTLEWEPDYEYTRAPPDEVQEWRPRPPDLAVLRPPLEEARRWELELAQLDLEGPVLSIVVLDDDSGIADEVDPEFFEVILVAREASPALTTVTRHPDVAVVELPGQPSVATAANAGLRMARGDHVTFLWRPAQVADGGVPAIVEAHERGHGILAALEPALVPFSFPREALLRLGGFPDARDAPAVAAERLTRQGQSIAHSAAVSFVDDGAERSVGELVVGCFLRGRLRTRFDGNRPALTTSADGAVGMLSTWAGMAYESGDRITRRAVARMQRGLPRAR